MNNYELMLQPLRRTVAATANTYLANVDATDCTMGHDANFGTSAWKMMTVVTKDAASMYVLQQHPGNNVIVRWDGTGRHVPRVRLNST